MASVKGMEMRAAYAETVLDLFGQNPESVYALEADLSSSMSTQRLASAMGEHYLNVGIMEAHMVSAAAGICLSGGYAFVHSFGQFLARRAMDQIFVSLAYAGLDACLVGSDSGVTAEHNGGTHMTFEDLGLMRVIPGATIVEVSDPTQFAAVLRQAHERRGLTYIRTVRKKVREVYPEPVDFSAGAVVLREGRDVSLFASGIEVAEALDAAELLAARGISAEVIDLFQVKPLNAAVVLASARKTGAVVTAENHSVINGMGSAVAELLAEEHPTRMRRVGVRERFGQVGTTRYLMEQYGLTAEAIAAETERLLS